MCVGTDNSKIDYKNTKFAGCKSQDKYVNILTIETDNLLVNFFILPIAIAYNAMQKYLVHSIFSPVFTFKKWHKTLY